MRCAYSSSTGASGQQDTCGPSSPSESLARLFSPEVEINAYRRGGAIAPPKTYESNFIHHDFVQFRKQHSRLKAISSSIVLSQQCCELWSLLHLSYSSEAVMRLDYQVLLKSPPPLKLLARSAPVMPT